MSAAEDYNAEEDFDRIAGQMDEGEDATLAEEHQGEHQENVQEEEQEASAGEQEESQPDPQEQVRQLMAENQRLQHQFRSEAGRQAALQRKIEELEKRGPAPQQENPGGMADADWETLKEDYPDIAAAFDKRLNSELNAALQKVEGSVSQKLQPFEEQVHNQRLNQEYAALEAAHPDWQEVAKAPEFQSWLGNQPPAVQSLMESESAADAAYLLDTYKAMNGKTAPAGDIKSQRQARLAASASQPRRGAPPRGDLSVSDEEAAFDYFAKQIDSQRSR